jgi:hypothetical protein
MVNILYIGVYMVYILYIGVYILYIDRLIYIYMVYVFPDFGAACDGR